MADNDGLSGLDAYEVTKLLFKNYMNCTSTSDSFEFYQENLLSNHSNIFSSGVLTDAPPKDPSFQEVSSVGDLETYLKYSAIPDISINDAWFSDKTTDHGGKFYVDSTSDESRTILKLERIRLDYLRTSTNFTSSFVCTDLNGTNILQNLVPFNYSSSGYDTQLEYENDTGDIKTVGWLKTKSELQTTCEDNSIEFGGALLDVKNGVVTFYDVENAEPENVFPDVSSNFFLTVTKYIGSTLADGGVGSGPVNPAGQTFHEVVTGAPQKFTMGDISSTLFTIDISWDFADIQPTESNNSMFNFPGDVRNRVIPYIGKIWFDISSSTPGDIDFSANITIDSNHNYAEDSKEVNGNIPSNNYEDLSYNLTYRTITLIKYSEDTRRYTVNVWGENESKEEKALYKLTFPDISFVPDSVVEPKSIDLVADYATGTITGDLLNDYSINDNDGDIVRFKIDNSGSFSGTFTWVNSLDNSHDGVDESYTNYYSSDGKWTFSPDGITGNITITIRIWTDFDTKVGGQGVSAEFYTNSDVSGFTSTFDINIFVDAEADFNPTPYTSDTSGISQDRKDVSGIIYATDADSNDISFSILDGSQDNTDGGLWTYTIPGSNRIAKIIDYSDMSAVWHYSLNDDSTFTGTDTFTIRTTDLSSGTTDISINIFVDKEATFSHVSMIEVYGGLYETKERLSIIDGDISLINNMGSWNNITYNTNNLETYGIDLSTAVATTDVNSGDVIELSIYETTKAFMIRDDSWEQFSALNVDRTGWRIVADNVVDFMTGTGNQLYTRTYNIGTHYIDTEAALYIFQKADLNMSRFSLNSGETVKGNLLADDDDGNVTFSINGYESGSVSLAYGSAEIYEQSDNSAIWHFTPATGFTGDTSFNITTEDPSGGISEFTINIYVDNEATIDTASDLSGSTNVNIEVSGTIIVSSEVDGTRDVSFIIIYDASYGTATIQSQADNSAVWLYDPDTDFTGTDTFTIRTTDTSGGITDISINIFVDEEAIFTGDMGHVEMEDLAVTGWNSSDSGEKLPLITTSVALTIDGSASDWGADDYSTSKRYSNGLSDYGIDFNYAVAINDFGSNYDNVSVTLNQDCKVFMIRSSNWNPVVNTYDWTFVSSDDTNTGIFLTNEFTSESMTMDLYSRDYTAGTHTFDAYYALYIFQPKFTNTLVINMNDDISGTIYATDQNGDVSFSIGDAQQGYWSQTDQDGSAQIVSQMNNSAVWLYNPAQDFSGNDTFTIRTTDPSGGTTDQTINIFVDKEADFNPTISSISSINYKSDTSGISQTDSEDVSGIVYATDADGDVSFSIVGGDSTNSWEFNTGYGTATILSQSDISAVWLYNPDTDFSGTDTFTIRTTDASGGTSDLSINIFVDNEATFSHVSMIEVSGGYYTPKQRLSIIDTDVSLTKLGGDILHYGDVSYNSTLLQQYGIDLTTAVATTDINTSNSIELTIYEKTKAFMIDFSPLGNVDLTGWTPVVYDVSFTTGSESPNDTQNLYTRTYNIGQHYIDVSSAFYIFQKTNLNMSRFSLNSGETVKGNLLAVDQDGDVSFSINGYESGSVSLAYGSAEIYEQSDNSAIWHFTPAAGFTGDTSFNITTEDPSGGTTDISINIFVDTEATFSHVSMIEVSGGLWGLNPEDNYSSYTNVNLTNLPDKILAPISTTVALTNRGVVWSPDNISNVYYNSNLGNYVDLSTAVATSDINTGSLENDVSAVIELTIYETTKAFMVIRDSWGYDVDLTGWKYVALDDFFNYYQDGQDTLYTRTYNIGTHYIDVNSAMYIFQKADLNMSRFSLNSGETVKGNLLAVDQDGDVSFSINGYESGGVLLDYDNSAEIYEQSDNSAVWQFTPASDFTGFTSFTIRTTDTSGGTTDISINIFVDKEAEFVGDLSAITNVEEDISGIITVTDTDGTGDVSFNIMYEASYGTATIRSQSDISAMWYYEPSSEFTGSDSFTIRTTDTNGGTTDVSINIYVDTSAVFTGDLNVNTNVGEDISGVVYIQDVNSNITYDISNDISYGDLSYSSIPSDADSSPASDISINWIYTADSAFTGEESFTIITTDTSGGISSQQIIISIPYIYEITNYDNLDTSMLSVHNNLTPVGIDVSVNDSTDRYDLSGNQSNTGYQFDIYKVDETAVSVEYLPSNMTTYGLAGINLSSIMKNKVFKDYSADGGANLSDVETDFYNSLSNPSYNDDIIVYIIATNKSTGDYFMARINKDLPGFDEMNPWYLTNKVNSDSTLNGLSSGLGSGALPSSQLQTDISNNSISSYFETTQINEHDPIIIHINSNAFENHYLYFATKL